MNFGLNNRQKSDFNISILPLGLKMCWKCSCALPLNMFSKRNNKHKSICRNCSSDYYHNNREHHLKQTHDWYLNNIEKMKNYGQSYYLKNKEHIKSQGKIRYDNNPDKIKANDALYYAVISGKINRPELCSTCGKKCIPDGHHESYSVKDRLNVVWLCRGCHLKVHWKERNK